MPKFGELIATDVWEAATRDLTDISIEEVFDLPVIDETFASGLMLSSASGNTYGSSVELSSDVGEGKRLLQALINQGSGTTSARGVIEFGTAADGGGTVIARINFGRLPVNGYSAVDLFRALTNNIALHVRVKDNVSSAVTYNCGVQIA